MCHRKSACCKDSRFACCWEKVRTPQLAEEWQQIQQEKKIICSAFYGSNQHNIQCSEQTQNRRNRRKNQRLILGSVTRGWHLPFLNIRLWFQFYVKTSARGCCGQVVHSHSANENGSADLLVLSCLAIASKNVFHHTKVAFEPASAVQHKFAMLCLELFKIKS